MQLAKEIIEFQHQDIIKEFRRISTLQKKRLAGHSIPPTSWMTHYGYGRQTGSTDAIIRTAIEDRENKETTVILTHQNHYTQELVKQISRKSSPMVPNPTRIVVMSIDACGSMQRMEKYRGLFFEHVLIDGPVSYGKDWRFKVDNILSQPMFARTKDIVMVGS